MSEKAPNTAISALIVIIVIFVVGIVFFTLFPENSSQIVDIFDEVFYGNTPTEEASQNTLEAEAALLEAIDKCGYDATINPHSASKCFCYSGTFGEISDGSYLSLHNGEKSMSVTAYDVGDAPLGPIETKAYNVGLFVEKSTDTGSELGCVFPTQFFIRGIDETVKIGGEKTEMNNWYVYWKDESTNKGWYEFGKGDDFNFGLYREKGDSSGYKYADSLKAAPFLYKVSSSEYCLVTDLLEFPMSSTEGYTYKTIDDLKSETVAEKAPVMQRNAFLLWTIISDSGQEPDVTYLTNFFTEDALYCNKL